MERAPLHLLPYLMQRSIDELQAIASRVGLFGLRNSKQKLVSGIAQNIIQRSTLERLLADMEEDSCGLLQFLVTRGELTLAALDHQSQALPSTHSSQAFYLSELMQCSLIGISESGLQQTYAIFEEVKGPLRSILLPDLPDPLAEVPAPGDQYIGTNAWLEDTVTLIGYLLRNSTTVMKNGEPSQREVRKVLPLLRGSRTEDLARNLDPNGPSWFERIFGFSRLIGLITEKQGLLVPKEGAFQEGINFFSSPKEALQRTLSFGNRSPGIDSDLKFILHIHAEACRMESAWRSVRPLQEHLYPTILSAEQAHQGYQRICTILYAFFMLGLCDLGLNDDEWLWRPHPEPQLIPVDATGFIHLQPNFEIVAPANLAWESRVVLEQIAELISIDTLLHYRITRASVYQGLCSGWSADDQIHWYTVQIGEKRSLPQNVHHTIESWGTGFGRIGLEIPLLLVCETAMLADDIFHSIEISTHCLGYLAPNILILRKGSEKSVIESLQKMGHLPHPEVGDGTRWIKARSQTE